MNGGARVHQAHSGRQVPVPTATFVALCDGSEAHRANPRVSCTRESEWNLNMPDWIYGLVFVLASLAVARFVRSTDRGRPGGAGRRDRMAGTVLQ